MSQGPSSASRAGAADFETAIKATQFGKFNVLLYVIALPAAWAPVFETTTMAYVFPTLHCDLDLTLAEKGLLNAVTFLGMISSGFMWGFLCDTFGRRKLLVVGYLLDALFVVACGLSQGFSALLLFKFLGGFVISGPFSALSSYMSEFHCAQHRTRVQLLRGAYVSSANLVLPLLAWLLLPMDLHVAAGDAFQLNSWNFYILVCGAPALISGLVFVYMPESPKFLMSRGRSGDALRVFQTVFTMNTGEPAEKYPIKELVQEYAQSAGPIGKVQAIKRELQQTKLLLSADLVKEFILICCIQGLFMLSANTLRLWLPQIFQAIHDYQFAHNGSSDALCTMLTIIRRPRQSDGPCTVHLSYTVYLNSMIVAFVSVLGYFVAASFVNILGKTRILIISASISGSCASLIYFSETTTTTVTLASLFLSFGSICSNVVISVVVDFFPTTMRTITIALVMMMGRIGSMIGNLVFPHLLRLGCAEPFLSVGFVMIGCGLLCLLLPNTELRPLV